MVTDSCFAHWTRLILILGLYDAMIKVDEALLVLAETRELETKVNVGLLIW